MLLVRSVRLDLWEFVCLARLISALTQMIGKDGRGRLLDALRPEEAEFWKFSMRQSVRKSQKWAPWFALSSGATGLCC